MKFRTLACLSFVLCLAFSAEMAAQDYVPAPVTVSQEKVLFGGKEYYSHHVMERQTLYGIAHAYGVTEEEILDANPILKVKGLQANILIFIPVTGKKDDGAPAQQDGSAAGRQDGGQNYIEHTVKWFEDIYDVASAYGVTPEAIMQANGLKSSRISKRQVLRIPVAATSAAGTATPAGQTAANPADKDANPAATGQDPTVQAADPAPAETDPTRQDEEPSEGIFDWLTGKGTADVALVLPFNADGKTSETNLDFYSGALMAIRDLEAEGVKTNLHVFDSQPGLPPTADLTGNDFVLGPVSEQDLTALLEQLDDRVPVISPLDQRTAFLAQNYTGFIQAPSTPASQYADLADWAARDCETFDRIVLVTEKVTESTPAAIGVREALLAAGTPFEGVSWTQGEGRNSSARLTGLLTKGGVNRIIVASEKEAFVADLVRNLVILLGKGYKIALYAPSRVRTFDSVDPSDYHQVQLHISSPYFVDYDAAEVKAFVRAYRALFRTEPSQFAFQGYDLTRFFAGLAAKYGRRWIRALDQATGTGMHTDFHFERTLERTLDGSFWNTGIRRIIYQPDYSTQLVR